MLFSANVRTSHTGSYLNHWETMRRFPINVALSARIFASVLAALFVLTTAAYATGIVHTLGSEHRTATGIVGGTSRLGYGTGLHVIPLAPGQRIWFDYDLMIANGELEVSFGNYAAPRFAIATGPQLDLRELHESGKGRLEFRADHWGLYEVNVRPACGLRRDCAVKYSVSWGLL